MTLVQGDADKIHHHSPQHRLRGSLAVPILDCHRRVATCSFILATLLYCKKSFPVTLSHVCSVGAPLLAIDLFTCARMKLTSWLRHSSTFILATVPTPHTRAAISPAMSHNENTNDDLPRIDSVEPVASTKWLALQTLHWTDQEGESRKWDVATRTTKQAHDKADAVAIIPLLRNKETGQVDTVLVEQYRPPVRQTTVEFPAGLIDEGETVEQAALRELREETGYVGEACKIPPVSSRRVCMSPGLCDETIHVVIVEVDMTNPYNINPKPELDQGEHCVVKRVNLQEGMRQILDKGAGMPIMGLYLFALGWELGASSTTSLAN